MTFLNPRTYKVRTLYRIPEIYFREVYKSLNQPLQVQIEQLADLILQVLKKQQQKSSLATMENYQIQYKLGSGNFAKVYLAVHNITGQEVSRGKKV